MVVRMEWIVAPPKEKVRKAAPAKWHTKQGAAPRYAFHCTGLRQPRSTVRFDTWILPPLRIFLEKQEAREQVA